MTLINKSIPSLFNGVSQQPPTLRHDTQAELSENAYPTIATGLRKRPPLSFLALLTRSVITNAAVHIINRSTTERYVVFAVNGSLQVYSLLDGTPRTVTFPSGTAYLASANPQQDFGFVTVADYTFILNRSMRVAQGSPSASNPGNVAYFYVALAQPQMTYWATVDGITASFGTGDVANDSHSIAGSISANLSTALGAGYSVGVLPNTSIVKVTKTSGNITQASCADGYGNTALLDMNKAVTTFGKLPPTFETGYTMTISGDPQGGTSAYYVTWNGTAWQETTKPGLTNSIVSDTMPWKLVRQADGSFSFSPVTWESRKVGDDVTNPAPSFVGRTIADIFYYRGRLGFLSDENVCMSRAGQYYNFWGKTATAVIDTDPIDTNVGTTKVSILKYAVPFDKTLLLFSDQTQFQLTGGQELMSPKTVRADVATEFDSGTAARPVGVGQAVYFGVTAGQHTGLREYYVDSTTLTNDAADVTAHVPSYLPANLFSLVASSSEDVIFALCRDEPNVVYVYKFFWSGNTKQQSAWLKFVFDAGTSVLGAEFINNRCYFILNRSDGTYLETMDLQSDLSDAGMGFVIHLDHRVYVSGTYDPVTRVTSFTLPYAVPASGYTMVAGEAFTSLVGKKIPFTANGGYTVTAPGNWTAGPVFFGQDYVKRYRFSEQYAKDQNQVAMTNGKLKLRRFYVDYTNSGYFRVEVQPKARDTYTYVFSGHTLGTSSATLGVPSIESGTFKFPVMTANEGVRIEIVNDSYLPSVFQSAGWDAEFVSFGRRM
ncbi:MULTISPECIES: hypothetical protein [Burkholderia]|uniref:phage nozzle protein n=1 Tax=Burkholderia TaxID=32008 RepID=UPI000B7AC4EE|nr:MULTISPECIES: hypothetical protein [Burkholderia]MBY4725705.1 hypothetical protein [Burkholderia contaminans]MCI3969243.1 hypothetical protein [Burkholderia sp. HI4860]OXI98475.1 phage tail protein [Burkholderia sp. AU33647]